MNKKILMFCIVGMLVLSTASFFNVGAANNDYVEIEIVEYRSSEEVGRERIKLTFEESQKLVEKLLETTDREARLLLMQEYNLLPEDFNFENLKQLVIEESENIVVTDELKQEMENTVNDETNEKGQLHAFGFIELTVIGDNGLILGTKSTTSIPRAILLWKINDGLVEVERISLIEDGPMFNLYYNFEIDSAGVVLGFWGSAAIIPWGYDGKVMRIIYGLSLFTVFKTGEAIFSPDSSYKSKNADPIDNNQPLPRLSRILEYIASFPILEKLLCLRPVFRLLDFR
jgi:hypothetical protein